MRTATCFLLAFLALPAAAAEPATVEPLGDRFLRDYAQTRGFMLGRPTRARPTPDGKAVLFLRSQPRVPKLSLFEFDVASGKTRELLTPEAVLKGAEEKLSPEEKARRERQRVSVGGFTDYQLSEDGRLILLSLSGKLYVYDRAAATVRELPTGEGTIVDPKFSPDGAKVAYVRGYDVYAIDLAAGKERPVTTGGTREKTHGLAEFVAQEEMDRFTGYWWSPDGKHIACEEADAAGVEVWYVADPIDPSQKPHPTFYPRPGKKNIAVRLGIVPVEGGETVWVEWDRKKYEYLGSVRWDRHGPLTVTLQDRKQQELALLRVDPVTGKTTPLLTEKDATWVNLRQDVPQWLPEGRGFLWLASGTERHSLQWRTASGEVKRALAGAASGFNEVSRLVALSRAGDTVAIGVETPTTADIRVLPVADKTPGTEAPLGGGRGIASAAFTPDLGLAAVTLTTLRRMPRTEVRSLSLNGAGSNAVLGELPSVAVEPPFTPDVTVERVGPGGQFTALVRPRPFDPARKYPVIVDVYGGPKHGHVLQAMRPYLLAQWLADQGFLVVAIDNRGTPGSGHDWERAIYQKFGSVPLEDQVKGLQALAKKHPQMDLGRVGIYGWSFGGYLAAQAVLKRPDVFHAAVAGAPVTDWLDYDTHYTERYLGLPAESPEAYKDASLLTCAADLKRPLLLVHGTADDNVYFRHTLKLTDALFRAGKDFEVLPLSGLTHMVPDPVVTQRLYGRIAGFFKKHLGEPRQK